MNPSKNSLTKLFLGIFFTQKTKYSVIFLENSIPLLHETNHQPFFYVSPQRPQLPLASAPLTPNNGNIHILSATDPLQNSLGWKVWKREIDLILEIDNSSSRSQLPSEALKSKHLLWLKDALYFRGFLWVSGYVNHCIERSCKPLGFS